MTFKKIFLLICLLICVFSMASVCASDTNDTAMASEDTGQINLSASDNMAANNLETSEADTQMIHANNDEIGNVENDMASTNPGFYSELVREIGSGGSYITLQHDYYIYDSGSAIFISSDDIVVDGNGAVIDMAGSNSLTFNVGGSGVTIKNLTIKNANITGFVGTIYFSKPGTVENCNFTDNAAYRGSAVCFSSSGTVENCNFINNVASDMFGGAVYFWDCSGNVTNCNFIGNKANGYGGAVYFWDCSGNVTNCNFIDNKVTGNDGLGGAVYFRYSGNVTNCNFSGNKVTGNYSQGGAVYFGDSGNVTNCSFTNNSASNSGGALWLRSGYVTNCSFTNNSAYGDVGRGGAIQILGFVTNCNFTNNTSKSGGGAIDIMGTVIGCNFINNSVYYSSGGAIVGIGTIANCNFTNNIAKDDGGAIKMSEGNVTNCNFINNKANACGGAVCCFSNGEFSNCNFVNNIAANGEGGAILFVSYNYMGTVTNCSFTNNYAGAGGALYFDNKYIVSNCSFTNNTAYFNGGAIGLEGAGTIENCNFTGNAAATGSAICFHNPSATKNVSNSIFLNNRADAEALEVIKNDNNITITFTGKDNLLNAIYSYGDVTFTNVTYWGANRISNTGSSAIKPSRSNKQAGQNITVGVVVDGILVLSDVKLTDENGMIVLDMVAGENYFISVRHNTDTYYTEAEKTISNMTCYVNITSQTTPKAVNITAKSNIYNEFMPGKLVFILPNSTEINATYAGNGIWWALHTFDDFGEYNVTASYTGLDGVIINDATLTVKLIDAAVSADDVNLDVNGHATISPATSPENLEVEYASANSSIATVDASGIVTGHKAGNTTVTITIKADGIHAVNSTTINVCVNRINSSIILDNVVFDYGESVNVIVMTEGAIGISAKIDGKDVNVEGYAIPISGLNAGSYNLTVTTIPDHDHLEVTKTVNITVNTVDSTLAVGNVVSDYKGIGSTTVSYTGATGVDASVIGHDEAIVNVDGNTITVSNLNAGAYNLTVTTIADANHNNITKTVKITVNKLKTELAASAVTATYNVNRNLVITLKDAKGNPLSGAKISVNLNGGKFKTDKNGQVKINVAKLVPKTYTAKITFNGDTNYYKSTKSVKVTVKKATPKLVANAKTFKKSVKTKKYTVTLKTNKNKPLSKVKVTLKVKGKTLTAKTNSKGKATFKIKNLKKKAKVTAKVKFAGNKYYKAVTKNVKITIK